MLGFMHKLCDCSSCLGEVRGEVQGNMTSLSALISDCKICRDHDHAINHQCGTVHTYT